jgi:putative endonuclease
MFEHKQRLVDGFTKKYNVTKLVYFEIAYDVRSAITREKQLKNWHKQWKINLVTKTNPKWKDLNENIMPEQTLKQVQGDLRGHSELVSESVLPKKQTLKQVQGDKVD